MRLFVAIVASAVLAAPAWALESAPVRSARLTATLISDIDAVAGGKPFRVALRLRMAPGWHTYWQNPGDAGARPELTLTLTRLHGAIFGLTDDEAYRSAEWRVKALISLDRITQGAVALSSPSSKSAANVRQMRSIRSGA